MITSILIHFIIGFILGATAYCLFCNKTTDIDREAPEKEFVKWYDHCLRLGMIGREIPIPNFEHWIMGCPRRSEEEILDMERRHREIQRMKEELDLMLRK